MNKKRGQVSIETLMILSLALLILIPASLIFFNYAQDSSAEVMSGQINMLGTNIMNKAEEMFVLGPNSWTTITVSIPSEVNMVRIINSTDLVINYESPSGETQAVFFATRFNLSTNQVADTCINQCAIGLTPGSNDIIIRSNPGGFVSIRRR